MNRVQFPGTDRKVLRLRAEKLPIRTIAARVDRSERHVKRILAKWRDQYRTAVMPPGC